MRRLLLVASEHSYRTAAFADAALRQGIEPWIAGRGRCVLSDLRAPGIRIDSTDLRGALTEIEAVHARAPFDAVLGTDDSTAEFAARAASALGLPGNDPRAAVLARRKDLGRAFLQERGISVPPARVIDLRASLAPQLQDIPYPCVVKPVAMSASRGVIRVDDPGAALAACQRIAAMLCDTADPEERRRLVAEPFIPGIEVALEGLLEDGRLRTLAIFDKPDPLDGPFFEESYYVTPARIPASQRRAVEKLVGDAAAAIGLERGPVHAECRINPTGVWLIEIAGRTIGGLCARLLRFGTGLALEDVIVRSAIGLAVPSAPPGRAAGVLMLPVPPGGGVVRRIEGVMRAARIPLIDEIVLDIREGHVLVPWPEGSGYPGFVFASGGDADEVEASLREAQSSIRIVTAPLLHAATA